MYQILRTQFIPRPIEEVWGFFSTPQNLNLMTPDSLGFESIRGGDEPMFAGQTIEYRIEVFPKIKTTWLTEITHCVDQSYFVDEQRVGPYKIWHHLHRFTPAPGGIQMLDKVDYLLPMGPLGILVHKLFVAPKLEFVFNHRGQFLEGHFGAAPATVG
ncbi:MAG: SRPBCC family protein [Verrucomicrobiota bacterium]